MSVLFDQGNSDVLEVAIVPVAAVPLTLACWFYSTDLTTDNPPILNICNTIVTHFFGLRITSDTHGTNPKQVFCTAGNGVIYESSYSNNQYSVNTWHHAMVVFTSITSRTAYLDGVAGTPNTVSVTPSGMGGVGIAGWWRSVARGDFSGRVAEVGIWNVALTTAEGALLAKGYSPRLVRPDKLVMYVPLIRDHGGALPHPIYYNGVAATFVETSGTPSSGPDHPRILRPHGMA